MGYSLRSKAKLRAKSFKRGGEFQKAVDERTKRLFEKSQEELVKQKIKEQEEAKENGKETKDEDEMSIDEDKKNVSTSGYRTARHHVYKKNNKKKKGNKTSFAKKK